MPDLGDQIAPGVQEGTVTLGIIDDTPNGPVLWGEAVCSHHIEGSTPSAFSSYFSVTSEVTSGLSGSGVTVER